MYIKSSYNDEKSTSGKAYFPRIQSLKRWDSEYIRTEYVQ